MDTLTQFHFEWIRDDFFDYMTMPFKNVHNLSVTDEMLGLGNNRLNFQQMFPSLRNLHLNHVHIQNIRTLELEYPHMDYLHADINRFDYRGSLTPHVITRLMKLNPQIKSINLNIINTSMLLVISNHLRQLENITFGEQLEEFELKTFPRDHKYTDFIINNRNLKKITMNVYCFNDDDIQRLASANLNAVEISLICDFGVEDDNLVKLIENSHQLERLHLIMMVKHEFFESAISTLQSRLQNEWILKVDRIGILLHIFIARQYHVLT